MSNFNRAKPQLAKYEKYLQEQDPTIRTHEIHQHFSHTDGYRIRGSFRNYSPQALLKYYYHSKHRVLRVSKSPK